VDPGAAGPIEPLARRYQRVSADEGEPERILRTVVGPTGEPIAGARVFIREKTNLLDHRLRPFGDRGRPEPVHTDALGQFGFAAMPGRIYEVQVVADGYAPSTNRLYGGAAEVITLSPPGRLSGRVRAAPAGDPLEGALVELVRAGATHSVWSDKEGFYVLDGLEVGTYLVAVSHPDHQPERSTLAMWSPGASQTRDFQLLPGLELPGRVVREADQSPVAGVSVTLVDTGRSLVLGTVTSAEDGGFRFGGVRRSATYEVLVQGSGGTVVHGSVTTAASGPIDLVLVVWPATWALAGEVRDPSGQPVPQAEISILDTRSGRTPIQVVLAGEDGRFAFQELSGTGLFSVSAWASGLFRRTMGGITRESHAGQPLLILLGAGGEVRGRCRHGDLPVAGALVRWIEEDATGDVSSPLYTFADDEGAFRIEGVRPGVVRVTVLASSFLPAQVVAAVSAGAVVELGDVQLVPTPRSRR
jgi:hypothetical protein